MKGFSLLIVFYCLSVQLSAQIINTIAGGGSILGDGGAAATAQTLLPSYGEFDISGNYYFPHASGAPRIRKISTNGIITTVAGNGIPGYSGDGVSATSTQIAPPAGIALDVAGNLYIADRTNNRLRKVDAVTGIITTIAGNGTATSTGNGGLALAATIRPNDVIVDGYGVIYVADEAGQSMRKINGAGIISHVANINGNGLDFDARGRLYAGGATRIYRIDTTTGDIDTIAGTGIAAYNGDGLPGLSTNLRCMDLCLDDTGNVYYADDVNDRVRKIDTFGVVRTVAGTGVSSFSGDGWPATAATLSNPQGVAIDHCGNLYIADDNNHRIRKVTFNPPTTPTITVTGVSSATIGATVIVNASITGASSSYSVRWFKNSILFSTTTVPTTSYVKAVGTDVITARVVPASAYLTCYDSVTSTGHSIAAISVGVEDIAGYSTGVSIYPNPAHDAITISAEGTMLHSISISNLLGQQLVYKACYTQSECLTVGHLPNGVYLVKVNGVYAGRFVKE